MNTPQISAHIIMIADDEISLLIDPQRVKTSSSYRPQPYELAPLVRRWTAALKYISDRISLL